MNLHRLDLVSLSLFHLVARTGSISRGAELALLAVGAASKRISDLEAAVGVSLLERHSRGVTLTAAGLALHQHAHSPQPVHPEQLTESLATCASKQVDGE